MLQLKENEVAYIKGILQSKIYVGNISSFCAKEFFNILKDYFSMNYPILQQEKQDLYSITDDMKTNQIACSNKKVNEYLNKKVEEIELSENKNYEILIRTGIKLWFEQNLIVQIYRPDTLGNSGDYTGRNEETDNYYRNNPIFGKFETKNEYKQYINMLNRNNYKELYLKWFEKNKKIFTIITRN